MTQPNRHLLLIDDDSSHATAFADAMIEMADEGIDFEQVRTLASGLAVLAQRKPWAVFLNLSLPDCHGVETLDAALAAASAVPIVVIGGADDLEMCRTAMLRGARDFLLEGHLDSYMFSRAIRNAVERETARQDLFSEKERAQVTLNSIGDAVLSTDNAGNVTYLNAVAERLTGWSRKDAIGRRFGEVFHIVDGGTHKPAANPMEMAIREDRTVGLTANSILIRRDASECAIEDSAAPIHDRNGQVAGAVIVFRDVSVARAMAMKMSHLAHHDTLTDLPNRSLFKDRLQQAISLARRNRYQLAVLFLDLDGFKNINDSLGHSVGDKLLQSVASRLLAGVRKSDTVSRQGGDEFVILLSEVAHAADAAISAEKVIAEIKKVHGVGEHNLCVTVSIGISTFPDNGADADTLIKNADTAMYYAKRSGHDNYQFFRSEMSHQAAERQSLEGQLRYAVERHELLLHYQPKVNLESRAITSVEALVRWQHPERGLLLPGEFLSIAEDTGMIVSIGQWVLREACRQTREWLDAGIPAVPVAVNISSLEFGSDDFPENVQIALKNSRLDPKYLELELTESVLMRHTAFAAAALGELKASGVRVAVDDFGTGYSSLSYLARFPIDSLKLDQSFVHDIVSSTDIAIIASAVISMGNSLKHKVIAEGVETSQQLAFLRAHGCEEGQGFYFSRPVDAKQFAKLLKTGIAIPVENLLGSGNGTGGLIDARAN
jgi:diguanylate cyclase (GGDEF)-like protein/PAS domain S-box-containing protein